MSDKTPDPKKKEPEEIPVPYLGMVPGEETEAEPVEKSELVSANEELGKDLDSEDSEPATPAAPPPSEESRPVEEHRTSPPQRLSVLLLALIPAILALLFVAHQPIQRSAASLVYPYQLDREEGFILWQAMQIAQNQTIYPPVDHYPYVVGNYPPIYPVIYAGLMGFAHPTLELGRAIVLLSVLVIIASLTNIIYRETNRIIPAILAIALFMATWDVNEWIPFARVDFTALAFGLLGLLCVTSPWRRTGFFLGLLFFTLAFFTKQTQLVAPAAAIVGMLWRREFARAILFTAGLMFLIISSIIGLNLATDGQFLMHTFLYNVNEMVSGQLGYWLRHLWFFGAFKFAALAFAIVAAVVLGLFRVHEENRGRHIFPEATAYLLFTTLSIVSIAKVGAAANYLLEFHIATALFIGLVIGEIANYPKEEMDGKRWYTGVILGACVVVFVSMHAAEMVWGFPGSGERPKYVLFAPAPGPNQADYSLRVETQLEEVEGDIISEEPIFNIRTHRPVLYQPFIMTRLAKEGQWEQADFLHDLEVGRFKMIVANQDLFDTPPALVVGFTPEMLESIQRSYRFLGKRGGYYMYVPKNSDIQPVTQMVVLEFSKPLSTEGMRPVS